MTADQTPVDRGPGQVRGLAGILLFTSLDGYAAMRDFWVEVLGIVPDRERDGRCRWGFAADTRLILKVHDEVDGRAREPRRLMINLDVDDAPALVERCRGAGATIIREPEVEHWGGTIATVEDPDGNWVQFFQLA